MKTAHKMIYFRGGAFAINMVAVLLMMGCAGHKALFRHATDIPSTIRVGLLQHNAYGELVVKIVSDPVVSAVTKAKFRQAYRATVCSKDESAIPTKDCANGPSWRLERAGRAYDGVASAQTEEEALAAIDALTLAMSDLINLAKGK